MPEEPQTTNIQQSHSICRQPTVVMRSGHPTSSKDRPTPLATTPAFLLKSSCENAATRNRGLEPALALSDWLKLTGLNDWKQPVNEHLRSTPDLTLLSTRSLKPTTTNGGLTAPLRSQQSSTPIFVVPTTSINERTNSC